MDYTHFNNKSFILIGLTGGIGSGKSLVSSELKKLGAFIIDADKIARKVARKGSPCWIDIKKNFGNGVLNKNGALNRKRLGNIIFNTPSKKKLLESITHPRIISQQETIIKKLYSNRYHGLVVVDAALIIESGYYKKMDKLVVVYADREIQLERLMKRDKIPKQEAEKKIDSQMPLKEKVKFADFVIDNNSSKTNTIKQVKKIYTLLNDN